MAKKQWRRYFRDGDITPQALSHAMGELFYAIGFHAEYFLVCLLRVAAHFWHTFRSGIHWTVAAFVDAFGPFAAAVTEDLLAPWRQMRQGFANLHTVVQRERAAGNEQVAETGWNYLKNGVRAYRDLAWNALAYLLPVGAGLIFFFTVKTVLNYNFALEVNYNDGQIKAYISSETVYETAHDIIQQRLRGTQSEQNWMGTADFSLTVVDAAAISDASQLANKIVATSSEQFTEATGVVVDGTLVGATADTQTLQAALNAVLAPYEKPGVEGYSVQFRQDVEQVSGLYFNETLLTAQELVARLTGDAPYTTSSGEEVVHNCLDVQTVQRITYSEEIPVETLVIETSDLNWGVEKVQQTGSTGLKNVTADIIYMDGVEVQRTVVSESVLLEATPSIILCGTYNPYGGSTGAVGDGTFIWPVPDYRSISRNASLPNGHRGMDIAAPYGSLILAADNGVVTVSQNGAGTINWSYGLFVQIDHGNGYTTLYGHCSELLVSEGEYVVKGQPIARVGSTGRSTGNHLHFEVARNGVLQLPTNYVTPPHGWS
jgi:murein DD-endopeptidase MepM/ murein hydrolase activator NlpD